MSHKRSAEATGAKRTPATSGGPAITVGQHSEAGRKQRNDDSYGVLVPEPPMLETKGIAMVIADGMSSSEAAKAASETCVKCLMGDYYDTPQSWSVKTAVGRVLSATNSWLHRQSELQYVSDRGMVSTISAVVLKSAMAHVFHAGDSRIYLLRGRDIEQLTTDHRLRVSREQEYLSRAMGISPNLEIDHRAVELEAGDYLIFTTDGVHDVVRDSQIANIVRTEPDDLGAAARQVVAAAYAKGSADNLTCQIVRIDNPGRPDKHAILNRLTSLPFPPELVPGQMFEGYRILRELHLSKRSQVYLAEDGPMGRQVVIKTPSINFEDDPAYLEMFTREEWIGQIVSSPHVLKVLKPARAPRSLYFLTEYVEGQTLRQWMTDNPRPHLETVREIVEQIAKGLRALHRKEIIHQDLKPENILIDRNGTVKIIDFGSSRAAGLDEAGSSSERPHLVGTVDYTAPEYHREQLPTNRSDIYSLGAIAYEMLTSRLPYGRGFANRRDVDRLEYISAAQFNNAVPDWLDAGLAKAVAKNPASRTEVLSALVEDLRRPNPGIVTGRKPLIERNPAAFWRSVAVTLGLLNVILLYLLSR
jgi:eukaryotic-like serine/threonine-protein kinase